MRRLWAPRSLRLVFKNAAVVFDTDRDASRHAIDSLPMSVHRDSVGCRLDGRLELRKGRWPLPSRFLFQPNYARLPTRP